MSTLTLKADIDGQRLHIRLVPIADIVAEAAKESGNKKSPET
jgi:hypothetical protein